MEIFNNYAGSAIEIIDTNLKDNTAKLSLKKEKDHYGFYYNFKVKNDSEKEGIVYIDNIKKSAYYNPNVVILPYVREQDGNWVKMPQERYIIEGDRIKLIVPPKSSMEISLVPRYTKDNLKKFIDTIKHYPNVKIEDRILPQIEIGSSEAPTFVIIGRQHPGETLSSFFIEEIIKSILDNKKLQEQYRFIFFPIVNEQGVEQGNHRYFGNIDYNRSWNKKDAPKEIQYIKEQLSKCNLKAFIDVHNDEISKEGYIRVTQHEDRSRIADMQVLKTANPIKRWLRALIKQKKIINLNDKTALEYISKKYKCKGVLVELSMREELVKIKEKGKKFIIEIMED